MKYFWTALGGALLGSLLVILYINFTTIRTPLPQPMHTNSAQVSEEQNRSLPPSASGSFVITDITTAVDKIMPSVVYIDTKGFIESENPVAHIFGIPGRGNSVPREGRGSGFVLSADGLIVTNEHVVHNAKEIMVTFADDKSYPAVIKGSDPLSDLAVLQIQATDLTPAVLGNSDVAKLGETVIAVGSPYYFQQTVTSGILSGRGRSLSEQSKELDDLLQTDAAINPGNSGGPLVNARGEVIGINTAIIPYAQGIGFAIPINTAKHIIEQLMAEGRVRRPYIGVMMRDLNKEMADYLGLSVSQGVVIVGLTKDSPALLAGIRPRDVILEFDGKSVKNSEDLRNLVKKVKIGENIGVRILRGEQKIDVQVKIGERG